MRNRRNYYRVLHVQPDAPREVIRSSYRALMLSLDMHPDRGGDHWNAALLNEAYSVISDPRLRREYDRSRKAELGRVPERSAAGSAGVPPDPGVAADCCVFCGRLQPAEAARTLPARCAGCSSPLALVSRSDVEKSGRRSVQRMARRAPLRYYTDWPGQASAATLEDLSLHGLRFTTGKRLICYSILKLESELLAATGRVVTVGDRAGTAEHVVGVEFFTLEIAQPAGTFLSVRG